MAQKSGLWAEFRLTTWGAVLTLVSVLFAVQDDFARCNDDCWISQRQRTCEDFSCWTNRKHDLCKCSSRSCIFTDPTAWSALSAVTFNAFMAIFNLIPFGILDGYKIFSFDKKAWAIAFSVSILLTIIAVIYTF